MAKRAAFKEKYNGLPKNSKQREEQKIQDLDRTNINASESGRNSAVTAIKRAVHSSSDISSLS